MKDIDWSAVDWKKVEEYINTVDFSSINKTEAEQKEMEDEFVEQFIALTMFCLKELQEDGFQPDEIQFHIQNGIIEPYILIDGEKDIIEFYDYIDPEEDEDLDEWRLEVESDVFEVDANACLERIRKEYAERIKQI